MYPKGQPITAEDIIQQNIMADREVNMSILEKLAAYLFETNYRSLPPEVIEATRKQILDTLGVAVAGSACSIAGEMSKLADMVKEWGGNGGSTILGFGGRASAPEAAFINAISSARLDYDDTLVNWINLHCSNVTVPVAFAMAERQGNVGGCELIAAIALGYDLACRIKQACGRNSDNRIRATCNFFGAAATAGKILGLDQSKLQSALFLAFHQMSGAGSDASGLRVGAMLKGFSNGFAARAGIMSALMAEKGFTGATDFLEPSNKENYYELYCDGAYLPWLLTLGLGRSFAGTQASQKEFPCCHGQHASLEAALGLVKEYGLRPDDIAEVAVHLSPQDYGLLADPIERKQNPQNIIETQFSIYWGVASALVYGEVGFRNFSTEAISDGRIRDLVYKVFPRIDMAMAVEQGFPPAAVDIKAKDGKIYSRGVSNPFGTMGNPMSFVNITAKFRECCLHSIRPIPEDNQANVISLVKGLEEVKDTGQLARLLG
jgi:2-methylcitrate dehydratase PrpD